MRARPPRGRGRIPPRRNPRAGWAGNAPAKGGGRGATVFPTAEGLPPFAGRPPPPAPAQPPKLRVQGVPCLTWCHLPLSSHPPIPYPTPMPTDMDPAPHAGIRLRFFAIESRAWSASSQLRIRNTDRIPGHSAHRHRRSCEGRNVVPPPTQPRAHAHRPKRGSRACPVWPPCPILKLKRLAALFRAPPSRPLLPIWDLFRVPPPWHLCPTWTARLKPATVKQVQSWAGSPMGTQTRQIQAAPILARFKSRSWTAQTQARKSRKKREKQCNSSQTHPAPEEAVWGPVRAVVVCSRIGQPSVRR